MTTKRRQYQREELWMTQGKQNPYLSRPPNPVAQKSRLVEAYDSGAASIETAEVNLARLEDDYVLAIERNIETIADLLEKAGEDGADRDDLVPRIQRLCVDEVKSQAGTFDYALASVAAHQLDRFLEKIPLSTQTDIRIAREHVAFMRAIMSRRLKGRGGRLEDQTLDALAAVIAKRTAKTDVSGDNPQ